jgi:hypothetical protein
VHQATIVVAVADEGRGAVRPSGTIKPTPPALAPLVKKLGAAEQGVCCSEAGPCGSGLQRQLTGLGAACSVVAPSLLPQRPRERIKTDRRDIAKLARLLRSGELTAVWAPDAEHEALRDLRRAREAARADPKDRAQPRTADAGARRVALSASAEAAGGGDGDRHQAGLSTPDRLPRSTRAPHPPPIRYAIQPHLFVIAPRATPAW